MPYKHACSNDPALDVGARKNPAKAEYIFEGKNVNILMKLWDLNFMLEYNESHGGATIQFLVDLVITC